MREILFRGKQVDNSEWFYGYYFTSPAYIILPAKEKSFAFTCAEVDPITVGQFTGLIDKNGKKIFEGDIVKGHFYYGFPCERHRLIGTIKFVSPTFEVCGVKQYEGERQLLNASFEVIGSVCDNPEMLKSKVD
jgi:uncharacterized phage protein (TIGR01671 family)